MLQEGSEQIFADVSFIVRLSVQLLWGRNNHHSARTIESFQ